LPVLGSNKNPYLNAYSFENLVRKAGKTIGCVDSRLFALKRTITQVMIKKKGMSAK
jgi:hypothetical protein